MTNNIYEALDSLPKVPLQSAQAYRNNLGALLEGVNSRLISRSDLDELIGHNPRKMMFDNHKHHGEFMAEVFDLQTYSLLLSIVPWAYRTYGNQGFSFAYFPIQLQAWRNSIQEVLPAEKAAPILSVYGWMLDHHQEFIRLSEEPSSPGELADPVWRETQETFLQALLQGDHRTCSELGERLVDSINDLQEFYTKVVQPSMYIVGDMWEKGQISVSKEHLASALVNKVMASQYIRLMKDMELSKGKAVVSSVANEFHEIGAQMVANCLEGDGWDVDFLGSNVPEKDFLEHVFDVSPDIVALSVAMPFNLGPAKRIVQAVKTSGLENPPKVMLGGAAFVSFPHLPMRLGADGYAEDCQKAVDLARSWLEQ